MRVPGVKTLRTVGRWLRSRLRRHAIVLGYHRVSEEPWDPFSLAVTPKNFAEQLRVLRELCEPVRLTDVVAWTRGEELPRGAVALTFDDGYADNLHSAKPLLEQYGIPATVHISTGYMGREFWWDTLKRLVGQGSGFSERLRFSDGSRIYEYAVPSWVSAAGRPLARQQKERLLQDLFRFLLHLPGAAHRQALAAIERWKSHVGPASPNHRGLEPGEIKELARGGLIEVGSHTVTHPLLPLLSAAEIAEEIGRSKADLEGIVGKTVSAFSFPNGRSWREAESALKRTGFEYACTSSKDVVIEDSSPFSLPRFWVPNWRGDRFGAWIRRWIDR